MGNFMEENSVDALVSLEKTAVKLSAQLKKMEEALRKFEKDLHDVEQCLDAGLFDLLEPDTLESIRKTFAQEFLGAFASLYYVLENSPLNAPGMATCEAVEEAPLQGAVSAVIYQGKLYVKTPPLFHKFTSKHYAHGKHFQKDYHDFYAEEVSYAMDRIERELPQIMDKTICVFSVYHADRKVIPDADNLDDKCIIDAIAKHFRGGDSGLHCATFRRCVVRDTLEEGAYISVEAGMANVPELASHLAILEALF